MSFVGGASFRPSSSGSRPESPTQTPSIPAPTTPRRSRRSSAASNVNPRLSVIEEDKPHQPSLRSRSRQDSPEAHPIRTHNRSWSRRFLGEPPRYSTDRDPPVYSFVDEGVEAPPEETEAVRNEKLQQLRNKRFIAKRGGWKRICLISLLVLICLVALVVGLGVGLSRRNKHKNTSSSSAASSTNITGPFPAGTWTFTTFLTNESTSCLPSTSGSSSSSSAWICPPSNQLYSATTSGSEAPFTWIINSTSKNPSSTNFTISSSPDPFSIIFPAIPLYLQSANTQDEHWTFTVPNLQKITYPQPGVICYFNTTALTANLYTRRLPSLSSSSSSSAAASAPTTSSGAGASSNTAYADWGHAVDAQQSVGAGPGIPDCYEWNNGVLGGKINGGVGGGSASGGGGQCACGWTNYS